VIAFGGEAVQDTGFAQLIHDIAMLQSLGVHLVLVHGARPQIEQRLRARGVDFRYEAGLRVTDSEALSAVKEAAGCLRVEIEALLSMGLANTPMSGARIRVASGNHVIAKPLGVRDGVDYQHTGEVRRIDAEGIRRRLESSEVVLLSPLGYSPTGEVFNLSAEDVATAAAIALKADKLIFLTESPGLRDGRRRPVSQLTAQQARAWLDKRRNLPAETAQHLRSAVHACRQAVGRVHLVERAVDGALLLELYTRDGVGTLITGETYERLRRATIDDVGGILELIQPWRTKASWCAVHGNNWSWRSTDSASSNATAWCSAARHSTPSRRNPWANWPAWPSTRSTVPRAGVIACWSSWKPRPGHWGSGTAVRAHHAHGTLVPRAGL
jgi:amino-acid N-acetyltransferase